MEIERHTEPVRRERPPTVRGNVEVVTHADRVRWLLARNLIYILAGTIIAILALAASSRWTSLSAQDIQSVFGPIFTALVSLVGSAVGFYFGAEKAAGTRDRSGGTDDQT